MTDLIPDRLQELRRIAEAATKSDWTVVKTDLGHPCVRMPRPRKRLRPVHHIYPFDQEDAEFIATFDPPTVLAMLYEIERLRREISVQQTTLENLRSALVAEGHEPGCPVVWGHSVDCVPGTCIETRTYRATYGEKGGGE